jgi:hypothetical protein
MHRFFSLVDWRRMLAKDYRPPMVPTLDGRRLWNRSSTRAVVTTAHARYIQAP